MTAAWLSSSPYSCRSVGLTTGLPDCMAGLPPPCPADQAFINNPHIMPLPVCYSYSLAVIPPPPHPSPSSPYPTPSFIPAFPSSLSSFSFSPSLPHLHVTHPSPFIPSLLPSPIFLLISPLLLPITIPHSFFPFFSLIFLLLLP
jgi:hypothetical protein